MIRMKKFLIFLFILFIFLSVSNVSGGLFGPDTLECNYFSIEFQKGIMYPKVGDIMIKNKIVFI